MLICQYCPILCDYPAEQHAEAFERFLKYKTRVPVRGAIMLNEAMDAVVLVKGWKKNANWSFPRGKINKEEPDLACAVREVYEETGYDLEAAGLVGDGENIKSIEVTMREQSLKLFVFRDVPIDTHFEPRTRKEISKIQWYKLSELPTIKKNKQHQEDKGEALAYNVNKFYMVAPFLGNLKKWIAQQKKLEKSNANHRATIHRTNDVSATTDVEDQPAGEGTSTRGDIEKLLDAHRQRKQQVQEQVSSDLPEVSQAVLPLGSTQPPAHMDTVHNVDTLNKVDLLAILKGGNKSRQDSLPQTPATQIIEEPIMPHSPPHHHLSRVPTLPMAPTLASMQNQAQEAETQFPNHPRTRTLPPPVEPGRLVPQAQHLNHNGSRVTGDVQPQVPALYRRARDAQGPPIPPASNLPKPILSQQKANLLDLFKKGNVTEQPAEAMSAVPTHPGVPDITPKPSTNFVPPQVLSRMSTEKASPIEAATNQRANLLAMFKSPPGPKVTQPHTKQTSLQLPSTPVELSASTSPGHSRETSKTEVYSNNTNADGHFTIQQRPSPILSHKLVDGSAGRSNSSPAGVRNNGNAHLGATINGPLNIPQFDKIAKHHRVGKAPAHKNGTKAEMLSSITILPRPESSHTPSANAASATTLPPVVPPATASSPLTESSRSKQNPAPPQHVITPIKPVQPPTPNLEAQSTPTKTFHPQILKRPANPLNELSVLSPIQPLPFPKQAFPDHKPSTKPLSTKADHKKSLLSLFTTPSPIPSGNTGVGDSLASLISPISDHGGPQPAFRSQMARKENKPAATVGQSQGSNERRNEMLPIATDDGKAEQNVDDANRAVPERRSSAKETPNELKNLLLGRLANIKV